MTNIKKITYPLKIKLSKTYLSDHNAKAVFNFLRPGKCIQANAIAKVIGRNKANFYKYEMEVYDLNQITLIQEQVPHPRVFFIPNKSYFINGEIIKTYQDMYNIYFIIQYTIYEPTQTPYIEDAESLFEYMDFIEDDYNSEDIPEDIDNTESIIIDNQEDIDPDILPTNSDKIIHFGGDYNG